MIILVTNRCDVTTDFVVMALRRRSVDFVRFNTDDLLREWRITWTTSGWHATDTQGRHIESQNILGAYYRRPRLPTPLDGMAQDALGFVLREAAAFLQGLYAHTSCDWISSPHAIESAEDKLRQLRVAEKLGFTIPKTLVTNIPNEARTFLGSLESAIVKPLSSGHLSDDPPQLGYTMLVPKDDDLEPISLSPHLLQERIRKTADIRVTVVDDRVFACRIASQEYAETSLDWRTAQNLGIRLEHKLVTLPKDVTNRCIELVQSLHLRFGAIDLIEHPHGYTFLEINPNGQWAWIEQRTQAPISEALADALLKNMRIQMR